MLISTVFILYETASSCAFICFYLQLLLTNQLEMEKMKVEQEKKKSYLAQEALKEKVWENLEIINTKFILFGLIKMS